MKCYRSKCPNAAKKDGGLCQHCLDKLPPTQLDRVEGMLTRVIAIGDYQTGLAERAEEKLDMLLGHIERIRAKLNEETT